MFVFLFIHLILFFYFFYFIFYQRQADAAQDKTNYQEWLHREQSLLLPSPAENWTAERGQAAILGEVWAQG